MKSKEKTKHELVREISSLQKQIIKLLKLAPTLKDKKKESQGSRRKLEERVECRTSAERMINRQLHNEIEQRKQAERATQDARMYAESIVDTVREPLLILGGDLIIISASRSFYQSFKEKSDVTEGQHIYELGNRQWDIPKLRELLEDILPKTTSFDNFEVEHSFPDIGKRIMLLNARKIHQKANRTQLILLAIEDITERRILEEKFKTLASHDV